MCSTVTSSEVFALVVDSRKTVQYLEAQDHQYIEPGCSNQIVAWSAKDQIQIKKFYKIPCLKNLN